MARPSQTQHQIFVNVQNLHKIGTAAEATALVEMQSPAVHTQSDNQKPKKKHQ